MRSNPPSLYLVTPILDEVGAFSPMLRSALGAGEIVAVLARLGAADHRPAVNHAKALAAITHEAGSALIIQDGPNPLDDLAMLVARSGADGAHASGAARLQELRERLGDGRSLGAGDLRTRHDAMEAGEIGVDYVMFGEPRPGGDLPSLAEAAERLAWWAEIFQVPCVAYAPSLEAVPELAATGAEFLALGDVVWSHPDGPAAAVEAVLAALHEKASA